MKHKLLTSLSICRNDAASSKENSWKSTKNFLVDNLSFDSFVSHSINSYKPSPLHPSLQDMFILHTPRIWSPASTKISWCFHISSRKFSRFSAPSYCVNKMVTFTILDEIDQYYSTTWDLVTERICDSTPTPMDNPLELNGHFIHWWIDKNNPNHILM